MQHSVVNTAPCVVFRTLYFLGNALQVTEFVPGKPFQPSVMQLSSILGQLLDHEESMLL
jgi:hypothetical protein